MGLQRDLEIVCARHTELHELMMDLQSSLTKEEVEMACLDATSEHPTLDPELKRQIDQMRERYTARVRSDACRLYGKLYAEGCSINDRMKAIAAETESEGGEPIFPWDSPADS